MTRRAIGILAILLIGAVAVTMTWPGRLAHRHPAADARIAYGRAPMQHADLWLPKGAGPFPVVLLIHGGCWRSSAGAADRLDALAADLRARGIAVWNVEYRGINQAPFPATFADVAAGADALRDAAARYRLDPRRVVAVGHSAGGHLALWLAARPAIAATSPLYRPAPLALAAAIGLGAPPDLKADAVALAPACGSDAIGQLVGRPSPRRPDVLADTSPARLPQPRVPITLISGGADTVVPPSFADAYARRIGGGPKRIVVPGTGHGGLVAVTSPAWAQAVGAIEAALSR